MYSINDIMKIAFVSNSFLDQLVNFQYIDESTNRCDFISLKTIIVVKLLQMYKHDLSIIDYNEVKENIDDYETLLESYFLYNNVSDFELETETTYYDKRSYGVLDFEKYELNEKVITIFDPLSNEKVFVTEQGHDITLHEQNFIESTYKGKLIDISYLMFKLLKESELKNIVVGANVEYEITKLNDDDYKIVCRMPIIAQNSDELITVTEESKSLDLNVVELAKFLSFNKQSDLYQLFPGTLKINSSIVYFYITKSTYNLQSNLIDTVTILSFNFDDNIVDVTYKVVEKSKVYYVTVFYNNNIKKITVTIKQYEEHKQNTNLFTKINIFKKQKPVKPAYVNMVYIIRNNLIK